MKTYMNRLYTALIKELEQPNEANTHLERYAKAVASCSKALAKLRSYINRHGFADCEQEICFFKEAKPLFYSKYIYYVYAYNFCLKCSPGDPAIIRSYIQMRLDELDDYAQENREFYQYYFSAATFMDRYFFTRTVFAVDAETDDFEREGQISTGYDHKLAKLLAHAEIQAFLKDELGKLPVKCVMPLTAGTVWPSAYGRLTA